MAARVLHRIGSIAIATASLRAPPPGCSSFRLPRLVGLGYRTPRALSAKRIDGVMMARFFHLGALISGGRAPVCACFAGGRSCASPIGARSSSHRDRRLFTLSSSAPGEESCPRERRYRICAGFGFYACMMYGLFRLTASPGTCSRAASPPPFFFRRGVPFVRSSEIYALAADLQPLLRLTDRYPHRHGQITAGCFVGQ